MLILTYTEILLKIIAKKEIMEQPKLLSIMGWLNKLCV